MPQHFSLLCPVLEPISLAPHCIPTAWRAGGQFLDADKDIPMAQDSLRDDLSFFSSPRDVMRKQKQKKKKSLSESKPIFTGLYLASSHLCQAGAGVSLFSIPLFVATSSWSLLLQAGEVLKKKKRKSGDWQPLPHM